MAITSTILVQVQTQKQDQMLTGKLRNLLLLPAIRKNIHSPGLQSKWRFI